MTTVPTKIVLKSTTRMSLNDRFSNIQATVQNIRANMAAEQQVSAANRRLAQQLANRPGLQTSAAGIYQQMPGRGGMRQGNMNAVMKKKSLQQRLGKSNIKNRLSLPARGRGRGRGVGGGGGGPVMGQGGGGDNQWGAHRLKGRGGFPQRGGRSRGVYRGRGRGTYNRFEIAGEPRGRGGRGGQGRGGQGRPDRLTGQNIQNQRGGPRGMRRGGRGQNQGRGGNRGGRGPVGGRGAVGGRGGKSPVSVQDLDSQLDEYMAKTKTHLDAELDAYMSEVTS